MLDEEKTLIAMLENVEERGISHKEATSGYGRRLFLLMKNCYLIVRYLFLYKL